MRLSAIEQARRAQEKGKAFLHETMERHRREEARERERERYHLEERVRAILSLKNNTESAQVCQNVRMVQAYCVRYVESIDSKGCVH